MSNLSNTCKVNNNGAGLQNKDSGRVFDGKPIIPTGKPIPIKPTYERDSFHNYSLYDDRNKITSKKDTVTGKITDPGIYGGNRNVSSRGGINSDKDYNKEYSNSLNKENNNSDYNRTNVSSPYGYSSLTSQYTKPTIYSSSSTPVLNTMSTNTSSNEISKKTIGLDNLGNTCYMNTSLQCLLHTEPFVSKLLREKDRMKLKRITLAFYELLDDMMKKGNSCIKSSIKPSNFKLIFGQAHGMYSGYSQQDSQEFLRKLLEDISKEMNRISIAPPYKELDTKNNDKRLLNTEFDKLFRAREDSIVIDTFYGQFVNIFKCVDCNYETYSFEKFLDIPLLLEDEYSLELGRLLSSHFKEDQFKWDSPCENPKCKKKTHHIKNCKISYLPEVLIFSFQRYNNRYRRKNTSKVSFKETIDLKEYIDYECIGKSSNNFRIHKYKV
jgi:ubiquitin C-terminal hydrolase